MHLFDHEHVHGLKGKELAFLLAASLLVSGAIILASFILSPAGLFLFSLLLLTIGLNTIAYLTPWFGRAWIFLALVSIFTLSLDDMGLIGFSKIAVFLLIGLVFELSFLYLKLHLHSVPLDMIIGSSLAMAALPLSSAFILSARLASTFPDTLKNLILSGFAVGLGASVLVFLLWKEIEHTKPVLRLYFYLRR